MPRPNKANAILKKLEHLFGQIPDHEIAKQADLSISTVGKYRRTNNFPAYQGYKFKKGELPPPRTGKAKKERKKAAKAAAPKKSAKKAAKRKVEAPKKTEGKQKRFRKSKLDPYAHLIGKMPDKEVAAMAGTTPDGVRMYRLRHGIPAVSHTTRGRPRKVDAPAPKKTKAAPKAAPPKRAAGPKATSKVSKAISAAQAFEVLVRNKGDDTTYVVVAGDIVGAAQRSSAAGKGTVVGIRHLAEALVAP